MISSQDSNSTDRSANEERKKSKQMAPKYRISRRTANFLEILAMTVAFAVIVGLLSIPVILTYTQVWARMWQRTLINSDLRRVISMQWLVLLTSFLPLFLYSPSPFVSLLLSIHRFPLLLTLSFYFHFLPVPPLSPSNFPSDNIFQDLMPSAGQNVSVSRTFTL